MELELAQQHKLIVERCKNLLEVVLTEDKDIVIEILNKSQLKIDNYNEENSTVVDATKTELGLFRAMVKRIVDGKYVKPTLRLITNPRDEESYDYLCDKEEMQNYESHGHKYQCYDIELFCHDCRKEYEERRRLAEEYYIKVRNIENEFSDACDNTVFSDDLKSRSISLSRSIIVKYSPTELQKILKKEIHKEAMLVFEQQNKELLSKYNF